jgi:outer membrane protein TolC
MKESVKIALEKNPDIKRLELNEKIGELSVKENHSQNFGSFNAVASYTHYNLPRTLAPLTPSSLSPTSTSGIATTTDMISMGISYDVALFTGFAQKHSIEISLLQKEMSRSQLKLSREQLIYNVKSIYTNILALTSQAIAQKEYIKALESLYETIYVEVELGKKSKIELLKSAVALEEAKENNNKIESNIVELKASLASLMNVDKIGELDPISIDLKNLNTNDTDVSKLERFHLSALAIEKSEKAIKKINSSYYPQVSFNAYYGQNIGPNDDSNVNKGDWNNEDIWQTSFNVKWNIFDFGRKSASSQKAKVQEMQSHFDDTKTELEFKKLIIQAHTKIQSALQSYKSKKIQYALSRESEKIEQIRFENGASDINDLLLAKAKSQLSLSQLINSKYQYKLESFYLDYLLEQGDK